MNDRLFTLLLCFYLQCSVLARRPLGSIIRISFIAPFFFVATCQTMVQIEEGYGH